MKKDQNLRKSLFRSLKSPIVKKTIVSAVAILAVGAWRQAYAQIIFKPHYPIPGPRAVALNKDDAIVALTDGEIVAVNAENKTVSDVTQFSGVVPLAVSSYSVYAGTGNIDHVIVATSDGAVHDLTYVQGSPSAATLTNVVATQTNLGAIESISSWLKTGGAFTTNPERYVAILTRSPGASGSLVWVAQSSGLALIGSAPDAADGHAFDTSGTELAGTYPNDTNTIRIAYPSHYLQFHWSDADEASFSTVTNDGSTNLTPATNIVSYDFTSSWTAMLDTTSRLWDAFYPDIIPTSVYTFTAATATSVAMINSSDTWAIDHVVLLSNKQLWLLKTPVEIVNFPTQITGPCTATQLMTIY